VFGVAFLLGPFVAALLLRFGWQWLFIVNLPIAAALMVASWRILPGALPRAVPKPFDWAGVLMLSTALAALSLGLSNIDSHRLSLSLQAPAVWGLLLSGAVACVATALIERRAVDPVLRPSWFASRQILLVALFAAGAGLGEAGMVFLPDLAVSALGMTAHDSSYILVPVVLALAIGSPGFGRLLDRTGPKPIVLIALLALAAGAAVPALLPTTRTVLVVAGALVGLGLSGLLGAPLRYILLAEVPADERAAAQGLLTVFIGIGQLLCGVLIGAIASSAGGGATGYREAFGAIGIMVALMAVASLGLVNRRPS
jgi:MFS family permease